MFTFYCLIAIPTAGLLARLWDAWWWLAPLYVGSLAAWILLHLLISGLIALCLGKKHPAEKKRPFLWFWLRESAKLVCKVCRVRIHLTGEELLPRDRRFVLVGNHLSNFDPITGVVLFQKYDAVYISKKENFDIPIVGELMLACQHIPLNRESPRSAIRTINKAAQLCGSGERSIIIFPEGHRSRQIHMLPFKAGAFHIAKKAHAPVVVYTIQGTELVKKNAILRPTDVKIDILKVIQPEEMEQLRPAEISAMVREIMVAHLPERYQPVDDAEATGSTL